MLWSTLSNALVKSTNKARTEPPWSRVLHQEWRTETNAWAVERPFKPPNRFGSRVGARKSQSQSATNYSRIFPRTGRREIGLRSEEIVVGGWTFGAGMTIADFQISGTVPSLTDALNTAVRGSAIWGWQSPVVSKLEGSLGQWFYIHLCLGVFWWPDVRLLCCCSNRVTRHSCNVLQLSNVFQ